jgi:heat shock protein HslJ
VNVTISGNSIVIHDLERGEGQCTNPPAIMEQGQRFPSALTVAESYMVEEDTLHIVYDSGDSVLHLVRTEA